MVSSGTNRNWTLNGVGGSSIKTVGRPVYPLPTVSITTPATLSPLRMDLAVAPMPPPPVIVTSGSLVYPDPPEVTVMVVTKPAVTVATAVAD